MLKSNISYRELIPTIAESFMPQMIDKGMLGLFELLLPEKKLKLIGRTIIEELFGEDTDSITYDWDEYLDNCHPDDIDGLRQTTFKSEGEYNFRCRVRNRKTGQWRWMHCFGAVAEQGQGEVIISGGMLDITDETEHQLRIWEAERRAFEEGKITYSRDLREIKKQEEYARAVEEHTRVMLDATPFGCILMNKELKSIDCNATALKIWEMDSKEDLINNYHDVFPETQPDGYNSEKRIYEMRKQALDTGYAQYNFTFRLRSGEMMPVEVRVERVEWRGEPMLVGYIRDRRIEVSMTRKLEETQNLTQAVLDGVPIGCFIFNDKNEIASCNQEAIRLYGGKDEQDVISNVFTRNMPEFQPDGRPTMPTAMEPITHAIRTGESSRYKWMARTSEGDPLPTEVIVKRISWGDGAYRIVVYVRDMRIEEETTRKMEEARNLTQAVLDGVPIGCFIFDENNEIAACNQEAIQLYGGKDEQDVIKNVFTRNMPEFQPDGRPTMPTAMEPITHTIRTGESVSYEWMARTAQGDELPTECVIKRIHWGDGAFRIVVYVRDLRVFKRNMAEIERQQTELVAARDLAEASLESKSIFLANMSHEIRTPITAIIGMTDIAKKSDDPQKMYYCLNKIKDASEHLLGIINDILDFSKIEAGRFKLSPSDFSMEKMLTRITDIMVFRIDQKQQHFDITIDKQVPHAIITDQQRLTQVIMNLLSNAHKFTPEHGRIALNISLAPDSPDDLLTYKLKFEVTDNGIGIAENQIGRLFDSFEQGDNNISRRYGGTGLGLAISKGIINQMNGDIWIESTPGVGSKFIFVIPVQRGISSSISHLDPRINISSIKIMIVDDIPETLHYFANIAESLGISYSTANCADECMRKLAEEPVDIVFVDWLMPDIDGVELTRRIRRIYGNNIVVIMTSAAQWEEIADEATQAGVDRFITKPLLPSPIIDCINECLGAAGSYAAKDNTHSIQSDITGKRLLLAEDVDINREIVSAILEDTGVSIVCAENGLEACNIFAANPENFDLILMDIQMPEVDGYTATKRIRQMEFPQAKTIPIIAMTANVFKEDVDKCFAAGMNGHIGKPIDYEEMMKQLTTHLIKR